MPQKEQKIAAAVYLYQADNDGEWGEIRFDFATGTAEIVWLAEWDTIKANYPHGAPVLLGRARDKGRGAWPILPTAVLFPAEPLRPPGYDKHNNVRCAVLLDSGVFSRSCS